MYDPTEVFSPQLVAPQRAIAHLSFVDERRVELFHEALIDQDFEWNLDELIAFKETVFVIVEIFGTYLDERGKRIDSFEEGDNDPFSTLLIFITCERCSLSMSDTRARLQLVT